MNRVCLQYSRHKTHMDKTDNNRSTDYIHICSLRSQPEEPRQKYTCTQQSKCKRSSSSFSAFLIYISSLTKYRYTWGRGACRHPEKTTKKTLLETEHTHRLGGVFTMKGHDNSFQETATENEFCFPKLLQQEQALLVSPMNESVPCSKSLQIPRDPQESRPHMLQSFRRSPNSCRWQLSLDSAQTPTLGVNTEKLTLPQGMQTFHTAG